MSRLRHLEIFKAILPSSSKLIGDLYSGPTKSATPNLVKKLVRIFIEDPWNDYEYIQDLGQVMLARHKAFYFKLVDIRQLHCVEPPQEVQILSRIQHPNVASLHDIYCFDSKTFLIGEHLEFGISQLELQNYELEEWEIATIIKEVSAVCCYLKGPDLRLQVIRGVAHISSLTLSCKELSKEHVRMSINGEIKIGILVFILLTLVISYP